MRVAPCILNDAAIFNLECLERIMQLLRVCTDPIECLARLADDVCNSLPKVTIVQIRSRRRWIDICIADIYLFIWLFWFLSCVFDRVKRVTTRLGRVSNIKVVSALLIPFVLGYLFINVILAGLAFLAFYKQIVGRRYLVMFVVENKSGRLVQGFATKVCLKLVANLANYWNFILSDDNAI